MTNRRDFIRKTSFGILGMGYVPHMLAKQQTILGHGEKRYRINTRWSQADVARYPVNDCHEMIQDHRGRIILLTNETKNNVLIYDKNGKLLETWGQDYPGAHGLTCFHENGEDVLFIADNARHEVIKTTIDGRVLMVLPYPRETGKYDRPEEYIPTETAIAPNGDIFIADGYGKDFIIQYDYHGNYIRHFGGRGTGDEHLLNAHGVCIDHRKDVPTLLVSSRQQHAFKRFSLTGEYLETIALPGAWVCRPVISGGYLYAAVLQSHSRQGMQSGFVTILDKDNRVISNPAGSDPEYEGTQLRELYQTVKAFQYPHDVCVDDEENLYVAQWNSGKTYPYKLEPVHS